MKQVIFDPINHAALRVSKDVATITLLLSKTNDRIDAVNTVRFDLNMAPSWQT
ncbi:hypothetical protein QG37_04380 [Candidozyma auris]|uniref:Uncharacterized protein n=1 Tax=Candidozyma auris TaxID=498019 RepID=A0A0L0NWT3_CANAR|nr:hypothetical protein QG37_04380 [[Candida] auris]